MNSKFLLFLIIYILVSAGNCFANNSDDQNIRLIDTVVVVQQKEFHLRQVPRFEFDSLRAIHFVPPSEPITDMETIQKILGPEYDIIYDISTAYGDSCYYIKEFRRNNKFRLLIQETDGLKGYYPRERIMLYYGGNSSDQAFFTDTGDDAYNPAYSVTSADKRFRITGLHTGQESADLRIEWRGAKQQYEVLCDDLWEIIEQIPYEANIGRREFIFSPFWVDNTLYFRVGYSVDEEDWAGEYNFIAITMPSKK
ncbi:hypothetical protein CLV62_102137 [Dysgonomonas alginatilytica]|uniref:Uncharacterized protein n=1 Tax=Dysgonomonas alginatilytica TaxID=1605892 RepID=A0A2V3Q000_9BACT|nr:hypothetical protein [Dysgonomonas alginatilytica]PXV68105.1 hypothetical protein CLV62_102137 [Dysgonomonas alginatilytica]